MILTFAGTFNGPRLMDELLEAFPDWIVEIEGEQQVLVRVETTENDVTLSVPDDASVELITAVVDTHDPNILSSEEQERLERVEQIIALREADPEPVDLNAYDDQPEVIQVLARKLALLELEMEDVLENFQS